MPLAYRSQCIYSNGASPATNLAFEISTYDPSYPVDTVRDKIIAGFLAKVGTNNGITFSASKVMIDGNPGVTTLLSGAGAGGVAVHIETAEYWNGLTTVAATVGNGPLGAAVAVAKVAAGKL